MEKIWHHTPLSFSEGSEQSSEEGAGARSHQSTIENLQWLQQINYPSQGSETVIRRRCSYPDFAHLRFTSESESSDSEESDPNRTPLKASGEAAQRKLSVQMRILSQSWKQLGSIRKSQKMQIGNQRIPLDSEGTNLVNRLLTFRTDWRALSKHKRMRGPSYDTRLWELGRKFCHKRGGSMNHASGAIQKVDNKLTKLAKREFGHWKNSAQEALKALNAFETHKKRIEWIRP